MSQNSNDKNPYESGAIQEGEKSRGSAATADGHVAPPSGELLGHPTSLWMLFSTEFWERFCYYGMRAILAVYVAETFFGHMTAEKAKEEASLTYGGYTSLVYATGILGGFVADRLLGYQRSILLGGLLMALGMFTLLFENLTAFLIGLSIIVVGNGLFKPNISSMVGKLYAPGDARRDSGFTIFYMGINMGAFFAPIVCASWIGATYGLKYGFLAAGIGMILGIIIFHLNSGMLGAVGQAPAEHRGMGQTIKVLMGSILMVPVIYFLLSKSDILGGVLIALMIGLVGYFIYSGSKSGDSVQLQRYMAMMILFVANILFWALFEQAGSSLNFLPKDYVDAPFNYSVFQSVNALFIVALAPVFAMLWPALEKVRANPSIPRKFAIALILVGFGFYVLVLAIQALGPDPDPKTARIHWLILTLTYLIHTIAELCLSPIGLSMVTKLAAPKDVGLAMGGWFLSTALANYAAGVIASIASGGGGHEEAAGSLAQYATVFNYLWWTNLVVGVLFFLVAPMVNKLMHGVK
jgi:POT family proton-dependent oligopeptide transporter